ncbi:beta-2 adrenergic receptor-like [Paramacrobiotus metropolitanus]|uniref:beta-2 adrenergic receptor-like n=1 Tax=Paramacrobiotus metropolitanus TaxID=2943436 RepID=UPI002445CA45|nr:beta-2 adrenergic receptor-like [Paramacrobiotus metropolitanus]
MAGMLSHSPEPLFVSVADHRINWTHHNASSPMSLNNNTTDTVVESSFLISFLLGTLYALNIIISFLGNAMVIIAVTTTHKLKTITNYLLMSLAVADLTVTVLVMPYALVYDIVGTWHFGQTFCLFWMSWDVMCCTASLQHLCAVSVDRYLAIHDPLHYYERMSSRKAVVIVIVIWINSSCISFMPIFMGWYRKLNHETPVGQCFLNINMTYAVISATVSFYIPFIIMAICYLKILSIALQQAKEIQKIQRTVQLQTFEDSQCLTNKSKSLASERKAIRTLGIIFGMFYLCWQPFFIIYWIYAFAANPDIPNWIRSTITWLGYINSAMNPLIYALNPDFRAAYKRIIKSALRKCGICLEDNAGTIRYGSTTMYNVGSDTTNTLTIGDTASAALERIGSRKHTARNYASLGETPMSQLNGLHTSDRLIDETSTNLTSKPS